MFMMKRLQRRWLRRSANDFLPVLQALGQLYRDV